MLLGRSLESTRQRPVRCPPCSGRPRHAGTAMQAEAVKQDLRMLRECLTQCSAESQKHKELLWCLVGVEWSPCPRGLGLQDPSP